MLQGEYRKKKHYVSINPTIVIVMLNKVCRAINSFFSSEMLQREIDFV